jgi:rhomboid protease GluP
MGGSSPFPDFPASDRSAQEPEILPPVREGSAARQDEWRAEHGTGAPRTRPPGRSWAYAPATYLLVAINCLVYLAMVFSHVSIMSPTRMQLLHWGANNPEAVLVFGQWWRVISAMFVHIGIIHLATNMWCLWNLGLLGEPLVGPVGIFAAYILSGAAGNLLSIGVNQAQGDGQMVGAGASGAVFGLAGVLIVLLKSKWLPVAPKEVAGLRRSVIYFAAINFVIGFGTLAVHTGVQIDNMAHLGGFLGGLLFAVPLVPMIGAPRPLFRFRLRLAIGLLSGVLVLFGFYVSTAVSPAREAPSEQQ